MDGVEVFRNYLVLELREDAVETAYLMDIRNGFSEFVPIAVDEELVSVNTTGNSEWESPVLRIVVTSFVRPARVFDMDLATGRRFYEKNRLCSPRQMALRLSPETTWLVACG